MSMAEEIVEGAICQFCMIPFDEALGFPRTCENCTVEDEREDNRKERQEKKKSNLAWSTAKLTELGIKFKSFANGVHLRILHEGRVVDFWPSTGKFWDKKTMEKGRGIRNLLKHIGVEAKI